MLDLVLILLAGIAGGLANALAGGGSLLTFPAFLAAGLPPVTANATNAVAAWPGHVVAAWAERERVPALLAAHRAEFLRMAAGGLVGALLLLAGGDRVFLPLVPPLLGLATLAFALRRHLARGARALAHPVPGLLLALYGGYFGAGLGVMVMAWVAAREPGLAPAEANLRKNLLATSATTAGILLLVAAGTVDWPAALVGLAGAVLGGWLGGRAARLLPPAWIGRIVIATGTLLTLGYAHRIYL
ncbi:sulfite exporter TauE/SafE family protein [Paracraurococcus ruber]|nr:sulfite exporter TauE/SafE family protein [Paracraurococcus ruber]